MAIRLKARSTTPGDVRLASGVISSVLLSVANVWNGIGLGDGSTGTKRASSIANCSAGNVKNAVTIDDVTGTLTGEGVTMPDPASPILTSALDAIRTMLSALA